MTTIGYGEDSLTHWALHAKRQEQLQKLQDDTPIDQCKVYYRPSFGRRASPQFGEFDAILATPRHVYLIESKWDKVRFPAPVIDLPEVQRLRHLIFTWLYQNWCQVFDGNVAPNWGLFVGERGLAFTLQFPNRVLAPPGSLLARNLEYILTDLTIPRRTLKNVLLYFHRDGFQPPAQIVMPEGLPVIDPEFSLITQTYEPLGSSGYFLMAN